MKLRHALAAAMLTCMAPALASAQGALPGTVRSGTLTQTQQDELNRRLTALGGQLRSLAGETQLHEAAVRNIAVEIFGAQPGLSFDNYTDLIASGARELRSLLTDARARGDADPALAEMRQRAIAAAEDGKLGEARALYDQLVARSSETLEQRWAREDRAREAERNAARLSVAADMAEAARLAFVAGDDLDAARRFGEAAARTPSGAEERVTYWLGQVGALERRAAYFPEIAPLREAERIMRENVLPAVSRNGAPEQWANVRYELGEVLIQLAQAEGDRAKQLALAIEGVGSYRAALEVRTRAASPELWAKTQNALGIALRIQSRYESGALWQHRDEAIAAHAAALGVFTREAHPVEYGEVQIDLGDTILDQGRAIFDEDARTATNAYRAAVEVLTPERSRTLWASARDRLANTLLLEETPETTREAIAVYESLFEVFPRDVSPAFWATTQYNLGTAYDKLCSTDNQPPCDAAIAATEAALEVHTREAAPRDWARDMRQLADINSAMSYRQRADAVLYIAPARAAATAALSYYEEVHNERETSLLRTMLRQLDGREQYLATHPQPAQ